MMKTSHTQLEHLIFLGVAETEGSYSNEDIEYAIGTAPLRGRFRAAGDVAAMKRSHTPMQQKRRINSVRLNMLQL
jgi:hypothetical protein